MKVWIGIDNGVSGSLAYLGDAIYFQPTPTKKEQSYTKKKQFITRVDATALSRVFTKWFSKWTETIYVPRIFIERPYVNPQGFKATVSAMRALEATLIVMERFRLSYEYLDSKQWQQAMLPKGLKGPAELKAASVDIGCRLFPRWEEQIRKHRDADSLLMAEWARRTGL